MSELLDLSLKAWFTLAEAAVYTGSATKTLQRAMANGELEFSQRAPGGRVRLHRNDLDGWVRGEPAPPSAVGL